MDKILVVARTEFGNAVRTKAFIASLLMLPIIYGAMILMQVFANRADTTPRPFAVIDRTGKLYPAIAKAAEARNRGVLGADGKPTAPTFLPSPVADEGRPPEEVALELSEKIRAKALYAFVEIPADAIQAEAGGPVVVKYYSDSPNYNDLRGWIDAVVSAAARAVRYESAGVAPELSARIDRPTVTENLGLASRSAAVAAGGPDSKGGGIVSARKIDPVRSVFVPLGLAMVIYLITMTSAPQLVSTVMEEKMSRISEMLLGSVSPFELMMGKLLGNVATAGLTAMLYLGSGYLAAAKYGYTDALTPGLIGTLLLFIILSIFLFGSLYMAVGSACSELKDAQSLMTPVMILSILPMGLLVPVLTNPSSSVSTVASLIPFASPILMTLRMAMSPAPPAWQVALAIALTAGTALLCVWISGRIFRVGLLMQGKAPSFRELARWVAA